MAMLPSVFHSNYLASSPDLMMTESLYNTKPKGEKRIRYSSALPLKMKHHCEEDNNVTMTVKT